MTKPDIQYFAEDGTWVKPPGAVRADIVLRGGDGGNATMGAGGEGGGASAVDFGTGGAVPSASAVAGSGLSASADGAPGVLGVMSFPAGDLPDVMPVTVGRGGRPGGRDGYALIVTHLDADA